MGIDYRFHEWRISGEQAEAWSPLAYRLVSKNVHSDSLNGFRIGLILYLHHIKGMTAKEIQAYMANKMLLNMIKGVLKGFSNKNQMAKPDSIEAYKIAMYMVEVQPEVLERMYQVKYKEANQCQEHIVI